MNTQTFIPVRRVLSALAAGVVAVVTVTSCSADKPIDRSALLQRNNPVVNEFDSLKSLTVGNGDFAYTVDATGMQTFPAQYSKGVSLCTMSSWGWHDFPNPENYTFDESLAEYDFGHSTDLVDRTRELYAQQVSAKLDARRAASGDWFRCNPHRLNLGNVGLWLGDEPSFGDFADVRQELSLERGVITSSYSYKGEPMQVTTACAAAIEEDGRQLRLGQVAVRIEAQQPKTIVVSMPYPTGKHTDDAALWIDDASLHFTYDTLSASGHCLKLTHWFPAQEVPTEFGTKKVTDATYNLCIEWPADVEVTVERKGDNRFVLTPSAPVVDWVYEWSDATELRACRAADCEGDTRLSAEAIRQSSEEQWHHFWYDGAVVDFSHCTDPRAKELERRVVLSQYLLAVNCAAATPPQETGLTFNSWFGKYHLEMIYWHQAWMPVWQHGDLLDRTLRWYLRPEPHAIAKFIAERQGFKGVRWMKMTDESGLEAPSKVGSFLIWQQPHPIYLSELLYRVDPTALDRYYDLVMETAEFMGDFATFDAANNRFVLKGNIPAQETLRAAEVVNSPYELSQWRTCFMMAQEWRERRGEERVARWDSIIDMIAPLAYLDGAADHSPYNVDSTKRYGKVYLAAETVPDTYQDRRLTSDHMAVLGALGIHPHSRLVNDSIMLNTLNWVWDNWNWDETWGWDFPMTAMCATRLMQPDKAIEVLLGTQRTNTYLVSGHNYQDSRLRIYLPGNGGLLSAIALMCAGWDGCEVQNPGFPKDGRWDVRWEGLTPLP